MAQTAKQQKSLLLSKALQWAAGLICLASLVFLAFAIAAPLPSYNPEQSEQADKQPLPTMPPINDGREIIVKLAGVRLIKPAQVQAAVRDSGAAKRLLGRLNLQGVVSMPSGLVAYIQIDKKAVRSVKEGDKLLELTIDKIQPGRVQFSLDGVEVELTN